MIHSRLKPVGRRRQRWASHQRACRKVAVTRAAGHCETCQLWYGTELEFHHTFGRAQEPWASELGVMLCHRCHQRITDELDPAAKDSMRRLALRALAARRGCGEGMFDVIRREDPRLALQELVVVLTLREI